MFNIDFKEKLKNVNIKVTTFLTPVAYLEYTIKMLLILKPKRVFYMFIVDLSLHILFLVISLFTKPMILSFETITISALLTAVLLGLFLIYRYSTSKNRINLSEVKLQFNDYKMKEPPVPTSLQSLLKNQQEDTEQQKQ